MHSSSPKQRRSSGREDIPERILAQRKTLLGTKARQSAAPGDRIATVGPMSDLVWYVSYGSNMSERRFRCYIQGGRLSGMSRTYPGCRDRREPAASCAMWLEGQVYFALESEVWGGGMAFLDPSGPGLSAGRGYLVSPQQISDVLAQEMHCEPGSRQVDVGEVRRSGSVTLGGGRYETALHVGGKDGYPALTFTAPGRIEPTQEPSSRYLAMLAEGLKESHGFSRERAARYLAELPGARSIGCSRILASLP